MNYLNLAWAWVMDRLQERTSWDGGIIIALGIAALAVQAVLPYLAWMAIAYGIWTLVRSE